MKCVCAPERKRAARRERPNLLAAIFRRFPIGLSRLNGCIDIIKLFAIIQVSRFEFMDISPTYRFETSQMQFRIQTRSFVSIGIVA